MLADGFQLAPAFLEGIREQQRKVKSVMAHGVTTVTEATPAREVAHLMHTKNHYCPVKRRTDSVG
jgi:CBS domain-containing protein